MPYRRPYRRTYRKKRSNRTYRKKWSKSRKGMGQSGKRFFKLRAVQNLTSTAGGEFATVFTNNPSGLQDWASVAALFDDYKVCSVGIKYIPNLPNDTSTVTGFLPFYLVGDSNDVTALATVNEAIEYENMKVKNLFRPWKYYYKFQRYGASNIEGGYRSTGTVTGVQGVKTYCTGLDISTTYGQLILTFYVTAKNRK